jgi:hypothetical protein
MEVTIKISVTTIIISSSEKPSGRFPLLVLARQGRRLTDQFSIMPSPGAKAPSP